MAGFQCKKCNRYWCYPVTQCIFCHGAVEAAREGKYRVIGFTQVTLPSAGNETVPYFEYLLENEHGRRLVKKSFASYDLGACVDPGVN